MLGRGKARRKAAIPVFGSVRVGADHLAVGPRAELPPRVHRDRALDELDVAVGHRHVAAAGVVAGGRGDVPMVGRNHVASPPQPLRHEAHWYCVEFGGTIVLNIVIVSIPQDHNQPRLVLRVMEAAEAVAKFVLHVCSHAAMTGPGAVAGTVVIVCQTS